MVNDSLRQINLKQKGFSLIELMVSIIVGLLILAAVTGIFLSMLNSNNDNLKSMRLNQDLRAAMSLMTRNIRRAGVDLESTAHSLAGVDNPFQGVFPSPNLAGTADKCITFSYDEVGTGTSGDLDDPSELFGYRWDEAEKTIEIRQAGADCDEVGWENMTDETLVEITDLDFDVTPLPAAPEGNEPQVWQVNITLSGELTSDEDVTRTLVETINIRN